MDVELVQASLNRETHGVVYTFQFTYMRRPPMWLEITGLHKLKFFPWRRLDTKIITSNSPYFLITWAYLNFPAADRLTAERRTKEIVHLCEQVFSAVSKPGGRISVELVKAANLLLGPNMNAKLKVYTPGELHRPFGEHTTSEHMYVATSKPNYGWQPAH